MIFGNINYLWLLLLIPMLAVFYFWAFKSKSKALDRFAQHDLLKHLLQDVSPRRQSWRMLLVLLGVALLTFALAQPKWGYHWQELKRRGLDVIVAVDVSKSMLAEDVKPNRLDAAKREIKSFINILQGDRVGIVAFAGSAFLQCPLTLDYGTAKIFTDTLSIESIPLGGTDIGGAIKTSIRAFETQEKKYRVLILITDGEDLKGRAVAVAEEAKQAGVVIFPITIGRQEGSPIPTTDEAGRKTFVKDREGKVVLSRADSALLQKIALITGGKKGSLGQGEFPLEEIYRDEVARMEKRELESSKQKRYENRYQIPLFLMILCFVLESILSEKKGTWRASHGRSNFNLIIPTKAKGAKTLITILVLYFIFGLAPNLYAFESAAKKVREGNQLYEKGKFEEAVLKYNEAQIMETQRPEIYFDMGNAFYRGKKYPEAFASYQKSMEKGKAAIGSKVYFNIGDTLYQQGRLQESLEAFKQSLALDSNDKDTKYNIEFVQKKMKEMKSQCPLTKQQAQKDQEKREQEEKSGEQKAEQQKSSDSAQDKQQKESQQKDQRSGGQSKEEQQKEGQKSEAEKQSEKKGTEKSSQIKEAEKGEESKDGKKEGSEKAQPQARQAGEQAAQPKQDMDQKEAEDYLAVFQEDQKNMILRDQERSRQGGPENVEQDW